MKNTKKITLTLKLCESAIMIALATILSLFKLIDLPYGGSITFASMLPIVLIAYRHGTVWGLLTGLVHGTMQFILGTSVLSYVTGWQSVVAVILLDYIIAFTLIGIAGVFKSMKSQKLALVLGALSAGVLRYLCHVISGATVWAGLSIPTGSALAYSFGYNLTYMLPETIVLCLSAYYLGSMINFSTPKLSPIKREAGRKVSPLAYISGASIIATLIYDIVAVFSKLQNGESGDFDITGLANVDWISVLIVSACGVVLATILMIISKFSVKKR